MKICFTSDLHGNERLYTQLVDLIHREWPDILLLGGDQCYTVTSDSAIDKQQAWLLTGFRRFLEEIRPVYRVYWTSGNHDLARNLSAVTELQRQNLITNCDLLFASLDEKWSLMGFPFGPVNGWPYWDWEHLDTSQSLPLKQYPQSFLTVNGRIDQTRTDDYYHSVPRLADFLEEFLKQAQGENILLLTHYPPSGGNLDQSSFGHQIGCCALRETLPSSKIDMVCSGHVHKAPT
jgi:Icc-related predicted phosphoesterase